MLLDFVPRQMFLKKHVSETGFFPSSGKIMASPSLLDPLERANQVQWLRLALSKGLNRVDVPLFYLGTETDPVSETLCS
jgi:hypothetical protein